MEFLGLTTATAPWFAAALLTGLLGLVGIITGAVVSYKSMRASDLRKSSFERERIEAQYHREDTRRWDDSIKQVAAQFLVAVDQAKDTYDTNLVHGIDEDGKWIMRRINGKAVDLGEAHRVYAEIELIAPDNVVVAGQMLLQSLYPMTPPRITTGRTTVERGSKSEASMVHGYDKTRYDFNAAVRVTLGYPEQGERETSIIVVPPIKGD